MKKKPDYRELLDMIRYLSYKSDYENLPLTQRSIDIIEYAKSVTESPYWNPPIDPNKIFE
jgi:hypothetical protein